MPPPVERSARRVTAQGLLAALLILAVIPAYLALDASWRPVAVRLGCAVIVVAGCVRLRRVARRSIERSASSVLDVPPPAPTDPDLDTRFLRARDDLVFSARSQRYFDAVLWPRLVELAGPELPRPAARAGIRRRGPSLRTLEGLIAEAEKRV
jgi:hypothetical protein